MTHTSDWKASVGREALSFPVGTKPIFTQMENGELRKLDKLVTWNQRDNTSLEGYITDRYHILKHADVFESVDLVCKNHGINIQKERILSNDNLSRMSMYLLVGGHRQADIKTLGAHARINPKDNWDVGFSVSNSLDGSGSVRISPYIERLVCTNGLKTTEMLGHESVTHANSQIQGWFETTIDQVLTQLNERFHLIEELSVMMVDKSTFLVAVEEKMGKRFLQKVTEQLSMPPIDNPLYNISATQLSLYDGLSLLTYNNHHRALNRTVDGVNESYHQVEALIQHFQQPENHQKVTA